MQNAISATFRMLFHLSNTNRSAICYATGYLYPFIQSTTNSLWITEKHVLRYLKGTKDAVIEFTKGERITIPNIMGYCDAN